MSTVFLSSDGLSFHYSGNPFDDANSRTKYYLEILDVLSIEQTNSLYEEIQVLIDRIFSFNPETTKINFSKSSQEKYLHRVEKLFLMFNNLKQRINLDESFELHDIYEDLYIQKEYNEPNEELTNFRKELSRIYDLTKKNIIKPTKEESIKNSSIFKTAIKFADKNGIYTLNGKVEFLKKDGTLNNIAVSKHFFGNDSCRTEIGYTLNKDLENIDEVIDIHNKHKNVFYALKNNHLLNKEVFCFLKNNNIELHPTFKEKITLYKIEIKC